MCINNFNFSNTVQAIHLHWGDSIRIEGNHIGTNADGTVSAPNNYGVNIYNFATNTFIGGPLPAQRNVISGNADKGVRVLNGFTTVENNYIGTNAAGTSPLANGDYGVMFDGSDGDIVDNVVSSNAFFGIHIDGPYTMGPSTYVRIQGNKIGTDKDGLGSLGNGWAGINIQHDVYNVLIGGTTAGDPNIIANNGQQGVLIKGDSIAVVSNSIYNNTSLGIDLGVTMGDGVTSNDVNDSDTGPNNFLNFIEYNSLVLNTGDINFDFNADLIAGDYRIEFFNNPAGIDGLGNGEGEIFIGATQINHGGTGTENFTGTFSPVETVAASDDITAVTIKCSDGTCASFWGTSEFSVAEVMLAAEICNNSIDDDGDGQTDCADSDCCCAVAPVLSKN